MQRTKLTAMFLALTLIFSALFFGGCNLAYADMDNISEKLTEKYGETFDIKSVQYNEGSGATTAIVSSASYSDYLFSATYTASTDTLSDDYVRSVTAHNAGRHEQG